MKSQTVRLLLAGLLAGSLVAGCGGGNSTSSGGNEGSGGNAGSNVIKIATQSPLSGTQSLEGDGIKLGAQLAVQDRMEDFKKLGFDLQLFPQDDQADPKIGVSNAEMLIADPDVYAVIGHYNTGVAIPSSVKYEEGKLAMISPANTGVELTEAGKKSVNRLVARNDQIAPAAAKYAKEKMGITTVYIAHDKTAYGQGLADEVRKAFKELGVKEVAYEGINPGEKDYSAIVNQLVAHKPDLVFYGGMYAELGIIAKQAREKGYTGQFMGGEGLESNDMYKIAGPAAEGIVYATVVSDIRSQEEGKKWVERFKSAFNKEPGAFSPFAYDATLVALNGIEQAIKENGGKKPTREQVMNAIRATSEFNGLFTKVSFDEKGDNKHSQVYIYKFGKEKAEFIGEAGQ
ncbi:MULTISPECIES: branched-chain amino acid ABC transporter substrate-binding protein [Brevibacillus]|jgi:branched-chain amino acid transport system substrate-binding protein|uniref:branched-chain amino acid ABC transporter substrate-binding protein n=1 Tax=Brevibacillus TaxID=55080 RepID=UPI001B8DFCFC|nr:MULTISPECIES: branched-chain amino acid ABC transporter substrate-binding protein [Bacillales]MBR8658887.1 branched-chain amino acid ABC transporter substrate-binding protein [Brevibacillus sp. NL20B1]MDT3416361.1 branched-chain amino acid transport system substrate-binding protein [Brevibacillus aydinogluensis]UFJ62683.1 branched-chain amino acid ABC transporter substrate-binding protein [Anoxybacillus sediminis]